MFLRSVLIAICCLSPIQAASLSVTPANTVVLTGDTVNLDVNVYSVTDLYAYQFDVKFDPTVLQAVSVSEGAFLSSGGPTLFFPGTPDNVGGFIPFNADTLEGFSGMSGSGDLVHFAFLALSTGSTSIDIQNAVLLDSSLAGIAFDVSSGAVTVGAPEPSYVGLSFVLGTACVLLGRLRLSALRR